MAQDIFAFNCLFQPGGSAANLTTFNLRIPDRVVTQVEFVIADGNRGAVSFSLGMNGQPIIPSNSGGFLTGNDETIKWDLAGYPDSGAWQLYGFNSGTFAHSIGVRLLTMLPQQQTTAMLQPLSL
jgi:hypothetical protein